ncbi:cytochrome c biogenesis protein ResB [Aestuariimicrobium ganziense]|uniref:cytochrome c biogenesis protein ResB n=1 Tax=Aestuariimicrobium ganziense TaxID=2773677 RepID=UPI001F1B10B9|nr:cytochrome c biogenesis protein ResB [Aestuariimicrobium ganziense]
MPTTEPTTVKDENAAPDRSTEKNMAPAEGFGALMRWLWTQITSMRTALLLLFLVAVAAIPGSLIPQYSQSSIQVADFKREHPTLDKFYTPLGMYEVFTSPWFSAIYLLLFLSLIGCIVPRIKVYARALRTPPPRLPSRLDRLAESSAGTSELSATEALDAAEQWLREHRFRVLRTEPDAATQGISAERGYLREFGNLLFHVSLVFVLLAVGFNTLTTYKGSTLVVEGQGFSNTITQYDEFYAGALVDSENLPPFSLTLTEFTARFETGEVQRGAAREFRADVKVTANGTTADQVIEVNRPITVQGVNVHLLGHGYAARVTVRDGNGDIAWSGPVIFLPQDGNFGSSGVIKAPDARPERLAFEGWFLPTATVDEKGPRSLFPDAYNPELFLNAWAGAPKQETGAPENVYVLDKTGLKQVSAANGTVVAFRLGVGETFELPDGRGSVTFDRWQRWTKLQFSRAPGLPWAFGSLAAAVLGLCLSLFVRPRRLFIKVRTDEASGRLGVDVGGLDRADARTGLSDDVAALAQAAGLTPPPDEPPADEPSVDETPPDQAQHDLEQNSEQGARP